MLVRQLGLGYTKQKYSKGISYWDTPISKIVSYWIRYAGLGLGNLVFAFWKRITIFKCFEY